MADLTDLRMNGTRPFTSHADCVAEQLQQARALLLTLESAFRTASEVAKVSRSIDTISDLNPSIIADALAGIATLTALAQHHSEAAAADAQRRVSPLKAVAS